MPPAFLRCIRMGGKVRTIVRGNKNIAICWDKKTHKTYAGEPRMRAVASVASPSAVSTAAAVTHRAIVAAGLQRAVAVRRVLQKK